MPRNSIGDPPFPPVVTFQENREFSDEDLRQLAKARPKGFSLCIRYPDGPESRGGYFFHIGPGENKSTYAVYDFEKQLVTTFSPAALVAFVNHCTGKRFDEHSFLLCQSELNFLKDAEPGV